jgi:hypothetical protein
MNLLQTLAACAGNWCGKSVLQDPHKGVAEESPSAATCGLQPDGSFRLEYTWAYQGKPQRGSLLVRLEGSEVTAGWTDTWHTGDQPMACSGGSGPALSVRGTYAAPPGPDWGWRIDLTPAGEKLRLVMWNIWPAELGGKEELAVEAVYARASQA